MTQSCERCGLLHPTGTPCFSLDLPAGGAGGLEPRAVLGGRYAIIRTIHRGGMSIVYLATDRVQGRQVAIKELRLPDGATAAEVAEAEGWFARESYLLSTLRHPLIPQFYSVFREQDRSYIVQEYVESESLEELLSRYRSVDAQVLCGWGVALCELLSYLHTLPAPVVFRDLKPANILLRGTDKRLVVVDFGIARPFVAGQVGTVVGTPGYAPPEQYQGLATPQSDLYALGATLHRLLTGHDPEAHAEAGGGFGIPPAESLNSRIPPALAAVLARALELAPAARYASAAEMGDALRTAERGPAIGSYPSRARPRANRARFGLAAVCLLVPMAVVGVLRLGPAPSSRDPAPTTGAILGTTEAASPTIAPFATPSPSRRAMPNLPPTTVVTTATWWGTCLPVHSPLTGGLSPLKVSIRGDIWFAIGANDVLGHLDRHGRPVLCKLPVVKPSTTSSVAFQPSSVSPGPDGSVWFTDASDDSIGIVGADGRLRHIALPIPGYPSDSVADRTGNLWFAQAPFGTGMSRILRLTRQGRLTMYPIAGDGGAPIRLTADTDGSIWFLRGASGLIWNLDPSGTLSTFPIGIDYISNIAADPRSGIWYLSTEFAIGHLDADGTTLNYPGADPASGYVQDGLGADRAGAVWLSAGAARPDSRSLMVRITPDGSLTNFPLPLGSTLGKPVQGADGAMWFDAGTKSPALGRLAPDGSFRRYPLQP